MVRVLSPGQHADPETIPCTVKHCQAPIGEQCLNMFGKRMGDLYHTPRAESAQAQHDIQIALQDPGEE